MHIEKKQISNPHQVVRQEKSPSIRTIFLIFLHIPLAFLMRNYSFIALIHSLTALSFGVWYALHADNKRVVLVMAYIVGCEVLWRAVGTTIFWEFGKYAISLIIIIFLLRIRDIRPPVLSAFYFFPLLPSIVLTIGSLSFGWAREAISFNLSGPLTIFLSSIFFSKIKLTEHMLKRIAIMFIAPLAGIVTLQLISIANAEVIIFTNESNFVTSGGFGPNQVSSVLGIGALAAFLLLIWDRGSKAARVMYIGLFFVFISFCAFTFSRNGVYLAGLGIFAAIIFLERGFSYRFQTFLIIGLVSSMVLFIIYPWANDITNSMLQVRFMDTGLTGRWEILRADIQIWRNHFLFGVGPGMGNFYRSFLYLNSPAAHTEISRLLAEHGFLGVFSGIMMIWMSVHSFLKTKSPTMQSVKAAGLTAFWAYLMGNGLRLALPGILMGIAFSQEDQGEEI